MNRNYISIALLFVSFSADAPQAIGQSIDLWIGTEGSHGIYYADFDLRTGKIGTTIQKAAVLEAGFLKLNAAKDTLYSTTMESKQAFATAYRIEKNNGDTSLSQINRQAIPGGRACHVNLDQQENILLTAQYGDGSIAAFRLRADRSISADCQYIRHVGGSRVVGNRQNSPHAHWIGTSPDNKVVAVCDLGKDKVVFYRLNQSTYRLEPLAEQITIAGGGPRHLKFHPNNKWIFVLNELSLTVSVLQFQAEPFRIEKIQEIPSLPSGLKDKHLNSAAEIRIHPNEKFLYTSNRGHDSISVFAIDENSGRLNFLQRQPIRGSWPRNFNLTPDGKWLVAAGKFSNTLSVFEVENNGMLTFTREVVNVPKPICVEFGSIGPGRPN